MEILDNMKNARYSFMPTFFLKFQEVHNCPLCTTRAKEKTPILLNSYRFGNYRIPFPEHGVNLVECDVCGLHYKDKVPTTEGLAKLFADGAKEVWTDKKITFDFEKKYLEVYTQQGDGSLIDIGSSDGALLRAINSIVTTRSALDVYEDPRCRSSVSGEYLIGFIEDSHLPVSKTYNVATVFDVFEHFYNPKAVARNLRRLLADGGIIFGETGDSATVKSPSTWWYVQLVEHHIFWNRKSLEYFCHHNGFKLELLINTVHKGRRYMGAVKRLLAWVLHIGRDTWLTDLAWRVKRVDSHMIGNPYQRDHMIFSLRKMQDKHDSKE